MKNSHTKQHTILWADDDPDDLMIMREVLQSADDDHHTIVEVDNGQKVLLTRIKADKNLSSIPVVVFTTSASELDRTFCKRYGVEMITKPPTFASFQEVVHRLLNFCTTSSTLA
jgi:CheY-like chemotaxis protein